MPMVSQGQGHKSHIQEISTEGGSQKCTVRVFSEGLVENDVGSK